jgi:hypothetical protein
MYVAAQIRTTSATAANIFEAPLELLLVTNASDGERIDYHF